LCPSQAAEFLVTVLKENHFPYPIDVICSGSTPRQPGRRSTVKLFWALHSLTVQIVMVPRLFLLLSLVITINIIATAANASKTLPPHIFFVIVDDFGWGEVGYHRTEAHGPHSDWRTPTIDTLVEEGVEMNRHYVHMTCTPSRAAFQSGRLPAHVLMDLAGPCDKNGAIPRNMTGIAQVLKRGGYETHQIGKWDAGMATPKHTPKGCASSPIHNLDPNLKSNPSLNPNHSLSPNPGTNPIYNTTLT